MHLDRLIRRARELGADRAAPLPAVAVVVDDRVTLKCRVPLCSSYGHNLMCPPNVMAPDETRTLLKGYGDTLVVQSDIPLTRHEVDDVCGGLPYAESLEAHQGLTSLRDSKNDFSAVMTGLETEAFKMGYRFAAAFSGGDCVLCEECVAGSGDPCRHPFVARPSMEAVGIDVVATAGAAGLAVELPAEDHPCWTGLLLID